MRRRVAPCVSLGLIAVTSASPKLTHGAIIANKSSGHITRSRAARAESSTRYFTDRESGGIPLWQWRGQHECPRGLPQWRLRVPADIVCVVEIREVVEHIRQAALWECVDELVNIFTDVIVRSPSTIRFSAALFQFRWLGRCGETWGRDHPGVSKARSRAVEDS